MTAADLGQQATPQLCANCCPKHCDEQREAALEEAVALLDRIRHPAGGSFTYTFDSGFEGDVPMISTLPKSLLDEVDDFLARHVGATQGVAGRDGGGQG